MARLTGQKKAAAAAFFVCGLPAGRLRPRLLRSARCRATPARSAWS